MRVLVIGGTGFIGRHVVSLFLRMGHKVAVFHRGRSTVHFHSTFDSNVRFLVDDRKNMSCHKRAIKKFAPDVTIDLALYKGKEARALMAFMKGLTSRVVIISSIDVYRIYERLLGANRSFIETEPLPENADLRETIYPYRGKVQVEKAILESHEIPYTILRLPMVYGPHDNQHRLYEYLKSMNSNRSIIHMDERHAHRKGSRGYVENVAVGIYLAAIREQATGKIYNIAEPHAFSEQEWIKQIALVTGWKGHVESQASIHPLNRVRIDAKLREHWVVDSSSIRKELGYMEPISTGEGIIRSIRWEQANPPKPFNPRQYQYTREDTVSKRMKSAKGVEGGFCSTL